MHHHGRGRKLLFRFCLFVISMYFGVVWMATESLFSGIGNDDAVVGDAESVQAVLDEVTLAAPEHNSSQQRCAICFFGLPRAFAALVLPSMTRNVFLRNAKYGCDYFVHYYQKEQEKAGRAGKGGILNPEEVWLMEAKIRSAATSHAQQSAYAPPTILFRNDTEAQFWEKRGSLVDKYRNTKAEDGRYLYYPWKARTYHYPESLDNIVKQW